MPEDLRNSETNRNGRSTLAAALQELIHRACVRGVHGEFALRFFVVDGTIKAEINVEVNEKRKIGQDGIDGT